MSDEPKFNQIRDGHYGLVRPGIQLEIDRLRRDRGELIGELRVCCDLPGARWLDGGHTIHVADFNLSGARARTDRAKLLADRAQTGLEFDWAGLLETFCIRVLQAERNGQPAVSLASVPCPDADQEFDVEGLALLRRHPVIVFGDGGTAKSYLGLYVAGRLAQRGIRVLFADWEFAAEDHRDRLGRLFGETLPEVWYVRCERPVVAEAERLRRIVVEQHIDYLIYDSIAFASDGPPEAAEVASAYYRATRSVGGGSLHLAHITKSEGGDQKPFGSAFWHNGARMTWYAKLADETAATDRVTIGLFNRKANTGPLRAAVGFEFRFREGRTQVCRVNLAELEEFASRLPLWRRMMELLRHGPLTLATLADELAAPVASVERAVDRNRDQVFTRRPGSDGVTRIALVERPCVPRREDGQIGGRQGTDKADNQLMPGTRKADRAWT